MEPDGEFHFTQNMPWANRNDSVQVIVISFNLVFSVVNFTKLLKEYSRSTIHDSLK